MSEIKPESQPSPSGDYENISRELIERIATDAVKLAIVRNSLEWDKDADLDEDDIVKDVVGCLTGDDIGCGEEEDADNPELCAAAFVRQHLRSHDAKVYGQAEKRLRKALQQCAIKFREYATIHGQKEDTPENRGKVKANLVMAELAEAALQESPK